MNGPMNEEGELLDDTLDALHRMADRTSHVGELRTTFADIAAELGGADVYQVMTAVHELKRRAAFLSCTVYGGTPEGRVILVTRRSRDAMDPRSLLLNVLTRMADEVSQVRATADDLLGQLPHLNLAHDDVKRMVRALQAEGVVEDLIYMGGHAGPTHPFLIRIL